jgi:hypothetical protein
VKRQIEKRQRRIIDLVGVERHRKPPRRTPVAPSDSGLRQVQSGIDVSDRP